MHGLPEAAVIDGAVRSPDAAPLLFPFLLFPAGTRVTFMPNATTPQQALKRGPLKRGTRNRATRNLLLMSAIFALSSIAAVCVTSGGIATVRSDTIEITNNAVIEVDADVATVNVTVINITQVEVKAQLFNAERINYFIAPSGGVPATNVKIHALIKKDLRLRAKAIIDIGAPPGASVIIRSGLGNVTVFGTRFGTVTVVTNNGQIKVTGPAASYDLETVNGNITGIGLDGPIRAKTRNGSINVDIILPPDSTSLMETRNGDVNVTLPSNASVDVFGAVKVGRIEAPQWAVVDVKRHQVAGVLNGGDADLFMQLKNGTIRLKTAP